MTGDTHQRRLAALKKKIHDEAYRRHALAHLAPKRLEALLRAVLDRRAASRRLHPDAAN